MHFARLLALFGCFAALFARAGAEERNWWPIAVSQLDTTGKTTSSEYLGPFIFKHPDKEPNRDHTGTTSGFRPFWVQTRNADGLTVESSVLYPIFVYRSDGEYYRWSIFSIINVGNPAPAVGTAGYDQTKAFDLWPFWFSRSSPSPDVAYHGLFPIAGNMKGHFNRDEISWFLWPLYLRTERKGLITTSTPWPFIQTMHGTEHGFAIWPLFGRHGDDAGTSHTFALWPLIYSHTIQPPEDDPDGTGPKREYGFLPFYANEHYEGFKNEAFLWPFFGYSDRVKPYRYHETRYFWPFLVQGHGDKQMVNRWGPFYTHSIKKGVDKTWYMWPLLKQSKWEDGGVAQTRTQFLYLLYWSHRETSLTNPLAAPADRTHVWPLFSKWDNGAGKKQFQLFSPFDVLLPYSNEWRETWTPFFAIYRYDQRNPDDKSWSALWSLMTWHHTHDQKEFHLGPIFSVQSRPESKRVAIGNGLFGWKRNPGEKRSHWFWFDFPSKVKQPAPTVATP